MNCPRCKELMTASNSCGISIRECLYCNGAWVGGDSLEELLNKDSSSPSKKEIEQSFKSQYDKIAERFCPECNDIKLYQIHTYGVELDYCPECGGLFFDEGELKRILPTIHKPNNEAGVGTYIASEGLFWVILGLLS